jgi:CRISPR-associated protein Cas5h
MYLDNGKNCGNPRLFSLEGGQNMKVLVFDLKGDIGHFRRPDTTATHATYPFVTRTALRGMLGSILGLPEFLAEGWAGIELLSPVKTSVQQLSLLGKGFLGSGPAFNRPTAIELVVKPHYRIYYHGEYQEELTRSIAAGESTYHTYLGSAFALTVPRFVDEIDCKELPQGQLQGILNTTGVVPTHIVGKLHLKPGIQYARVGGMQYEYLGERRFRGTINLIWEVNGCQVAFSPSLNRGGPPVKIVCLPSQEIVVLW